jgi:hypothetical protein
MLVQTVQNLQGVWVDVTARDGMFRARNQERIHEI